MVTDRSKISEFPRRSKQPHTFDAGAERDIIAGLLTPSVSAESWRKIRGILAAEDFYRADHRDIFIAIEKMIRAGEPVDPVTVADALNDPDMPVAALADLALRWSGSPHAQEHAKVVRRYALLRQQAAAAAKGDYAEIARLEVEKTILLRPEDDPRYSFTAAEVMRRETADQRWIVPGLLPEGTTFLLGKPKAKKSWFALNVAVAVATGGKALGGIDCEQGDVLFLALDRYTDAKVKRRLISMRVEREPERMHFRLKWPKLASGCGEAIDDWLTQHPGARLVVIDVLQKVRPRMSGNRNMFADDYAVGDELVPIANKHSVAILILHHTRKGDDTDPTEAINGSNGLTGSVDNTLLLYRQQGGHFLNVQAGDMEDKELALAWDPSCCMLSIQGDADEVRMSDERKEIVELLRDNGPMSQKVIALALGKKLYTVKYLMSKLCESEVTRPTMDRKRYELIPEKTVKSPNTPNGPNGPNGPNTPNESGGEGVSGESGVRGVRGVRGFLQKTDPTIPRTGGYVPPFVPVDDKEG